MPITGATRWFTYLVCLKQDDEVSELYLIAENLEDAAFKAQEIAYQRNCTLIDVIRYE